ncbi:reverse transcriptase [Plakobranchus ocellatus]|uniref:Reverse transcriptase n=1 Tax=Plakobranchus ocellatus TaxID=259542 RepID=A0AAV3Y6R1_9GAST|nr:reverse transcriptase [Plakobranchus ocellatus]
MCRCKASEAMARWKQSFAIINGDRSTSRENLDSKWSLKHFRTMLHLCAQTERENTSDEDASPDIFLGLIFGDNCNEFSTERHTTDCINLEVGIAMGCTKSPILFVWAMEVILRATKENESPNGDGSYMPPLKAFTDDTTILCSKENETRRMLFG